MSREDSKITRLEIINHAKNDKAVGRLLTLYREMGDFENVELSYQDGGRTLKIFLVGDAANPSPETPLNKELGYNNEVQDRKG